MKVKEKFTSASDCLIILVNHRENGIATGKLMHGYFNGQITFYSVDDLFIKMDALLDALELPQKSSDIRAFGSGNRQAKMIEDYKNKIVPEPVLKLCDIPDRGRLATFFVHIVYRQHSCWQGQIVWSDGGEIRYFRSSLELLHLLYDALEISEAGHGLPPVFAHEEC